MLIYSFSAAQAANAVGVAHALRHLETSVSERPKLMESMTRNSQRIYTLEPGSASWAEAGTLQVPRDRYYRALDMMARALYFAHHKERWMGGVLVVPRNMLQAKQDGGLGPFADFQRMHRLADKVLENSQRLGANPQVFYYQQTRLKDIACIRGTFYGGIQIFFGFHHDEDKLQEALLAEGSPEI